MPSPSKESSSGEKFVIMLLDLLELFVKKFPKLTLHGLQKTLKINVSKATEMY